MMSPILIWFIAGGAIAGILLRPGNWPEAVWASLGALLIVIGGLISVAQAGHAIAKGTDVYLFLAGMMMLAELARREGVFDWLAGRALNAADGSPERLFGLIYIVGIAVTVFLSNDATAVVLTPAVYAAAHKAKTKSLPYLFICAFIANAASFVLPISNPANLVIYGKSIPPLLPWLRTFLLPSVCSIGVTYLAMRWIFRKDLQGSLDKCGEICPLSNEGRMAAWGIAGTGTILTGASSLGLDLGLPTLLSATAAVLIVSRGKRQVIGEIVRSVSWSVVPLVAGLFVLVEALNQAGAYNGTAQALRWCMGLPRYAGALVASSGIAGLSNLMNNLPAGLLLGNALQGMPAPPYIHNAVLVGVDLGPNLSITGSLATVLWLMALRREGEQIDGWQFLKTGMVVTPPALLLTTLVSTLFA